MGGGRHQARARLLTYAVYWTDRPYNVYWWVGAQGESLGFYFNVADSVELTREVFAWRDLSLDVLVRVDGSAEVLDEAEIPPDLPQDLRAYIEAARDRILAAAGGLVDEVRSIVETALSPSRRR